MTNVTLFPFADVWWVYPVFTIFVVVLLLLDLGVFHRKAHVVQFREALTWTCIWMFLALLFNISLYFFALWKFEQDPRLMALPGFVPQAEAKRIALEFLSGYVVEETLSVDNMFVFVLVFSYFRIPQAYQHRILFYGILGAIFFRAIFIALGSLLLQYTWVVWIFGAFLIYSGIRMAFSSTDEGIDFENNFVLKLFSRWLPVSRQLYGSKFFAFEDGRRVATPLLLTLAFVEASDIVFAVDSVPAVFALTREPLVVFTSNIFAILGLRSIYFLLAGAVNRFHLLHYGLAIILVFVGLKMVWLNQAFGGHFPTVWSLVIICGVLGASMGFSLLFPPKQSVLHLPPEA
jgi:tellurite resistance protein TerC